MSTTEKPLSGIIVTEEFKAACCKVLGIDRFTSDDIDAVWARMPAIKAEMAKAGTQRLQYTEVVGPDGKLQGTSKRVGLILHTTAPTATE
jgi:hypothetical protein